MRDILPGETAQWQWLEGVVKSVLQGYCYREIRMPVLEKTELFSRSIGAGTDIVNKEMYTFSDRNDELLTLRPEGTAGCGRALLQHGLANAGPLRVWYQGPHVPSRTAAKGTVAAISSSRRRGLRHRKRRHRRGNDPDVRAPLEPPWDSRICGCKSIL